MEIRYSAKDNINGSSKILESYRRHVRDIVESSDFTKNESALATWKDTSMKEGIKRVVSALGQVKHVVLVGIGGSSLGAQAIHSALYTGDVELHTLDSVSPYRIAEVVKELTHSSPNDITICAISKSGSTTETLTNTSIILYELGKIYGKTPYDRLICIGDLDNPLLKAGEKAGAHVLPMHKIVGGRYSVFTAVGLVPIALLGYNVDEILSGVRTATSSEYEPQAAEAAENLFRHLQTGVRNVNFFAFDLRLEKLGFWYRQLTAESLGKEKDVDGNKVEIGFIPTISTPVELHSIGQLYFSGFEGVYTDFVRFDKRSIDYSIRDDSAIAEKLQGKSMSEIHEAIYGGVISAYKERDLPHKITTLEYGSKYDLGFFMGMRMLETMYLAKLMNVNAFDQPNVELYKNITKDILDV